MKTKIPIQLLPHQIYLLKVESNIISYPLYKIGLTSNLKRRIKSMNNTEKKESIVKGLGRLNQIEVIYLSPTMPMNCTYFLESLLKKEFSKYKYTGLPILANGNSELFTDIVIESFTAIVNKELELLLERRVIDFY